MLLISIGTPWTALPDRPFGVWSVHGPPGPLLEVRIDGTRSLAPTAEQ